MALTKLNSASVIDRLPTGSVIQTYTSKKLDDQAFTAQSMADITGMSLTVVPKSTSSKFLISWHLSWAHNGDNVHGHINLVGGSANLLLSDTASSRRRATMTLNMSSIVSSMFNTSGVFLDAPNTTNAHTYKLQAESSNGQVWYVNRSGRDADNANYDGRGTSTFCVQEIKG